MADTLTESISSRLNRAASGAIVVVQQRLHVDDLTGTLLKAGGWEHLCLPLQAMEQATYPTINGAWVRATGDVLHPELIPLDTIPKLRSQYGDRTFYAQFQQAPSSVVGEIVKPDELREVALFPYDRTKSYTLSIDTAAKAGPTSDYTAFLVIASDAQAHYVVDVVRTRVDLGGMRDIALNLCRNHGVGRVIIEDSASGPGLEMLLRERGCPVQLVNVGTRDKVTRLEDCRLFFSERRICIFRGMHWTREFIEELLRFPDADFDDMVDAFSLYLNDALKLRIINAGGAAFPGGWQDYHVRVSTDRLTWRMIPTRYADGVLSFEWRGSGDLVWFATFAPYPMERHHALVACTAARPGVAY